MNTSKKIALSLATAVVASVALAPATAEAQVYTRRGDAYDRPVPRRGGDWVVRPLVDRAERQSNAFRHWYEKTYSRRHLGRDADARDFKHDIQRLDEAMERVRAKADDHRPGIGRDELRTAIVRAREIDREIGRDRDTRFTYREWSDLRDTLNDLARLYDLRGI